MHPSGKRLSPISLLLVLSVVFQPFTLKHICSTLTFICRFSSLSTFCLVVISYFIFYFLGKVIVLFGKSSRLFRLFK